MAVRVAVANYKGGVAKSTSVMMVAESLALFHGYRVLVVDFDPQATASKLLIGPEAVREAARQKRTLGSVLELFAEGKEIQLAQFRMKASDLIELRDTHDKRRVDIIPSDPILLEKFSALEDIIRSKHSNQATSLILRDLFEEQFFGPIDKNYEVIIFDCPSGFAGGLTDAALHLCSHVVAPTNMERASYSVLRDFVRHVLNDKNGLADKIAIHVLPTLFMKVNPLQCQMLDELKGSNVLNLITRPIPHSTAIQTAALHPGAGAFRSAREKYGVALGDVKALGKTVITLIGSAI